MQAIESGSSRGWEPPTVLNILFEFYSFIGLAVLFLSRNEIRAGYFENIQLYQLILPGLLAILMGNLLCKATKNRVFILKPHALILSVTVIYGVVFYLFSYK